MQLNTFLTVSSLSELSGCSILYRVFHFKKIEKKAISSFDCTCKLKTLFNELFTRIFGEKIVLYRVTDLRFIRYIMLN